MKKKKRVFIPESEAKENVKKSFRNFNWRLALKELIIFTVTFLLYNGALKIAEIKQSIVIENIALISITAIMTLLGVAFIIVNRGVSRDIPTEDDLPNEWEKEKKTEFIAEIKECRNKSKKILVWLIPVIFTFLFDMIRVFLF